MFSVYLFDLDGTLIDRLPSLKRFLPKQYACYHAFDSSLAERFTERFLELDQSGHKPKSELYETLIHEFGLDASVSELVTDFRINAFRECPAEPGALQLLEQLRLRGKKLGVVTNGSVVAQQQKLDASGIQTRVDLALISEDVGMRKPDPAIFRRAAQHFDAEPSDCVFIGDHPEKDIIGAQQVGMHTVWLRNGRNWPSHLETRPNSMITQLTELSIA